MCRQSPNGLRISSKRDLKRSERAVHREAYPEMDTSQSATRKEVDDAAARAFAAQGNRSPLQQRQKRFQISSREPIIFLTYLAFFIVFFNSLYSGEYL